LARKVTLDAVPAKTYWIASPEQASDV